MRIAILSDTHDNIWRLESALPQLAEADVVLHCGDLCSPFMVDRLALGVKGKPIHLVWGNNDGDRQMITVAAAKAGNFFLHGELAELDLEGTRVAMTHYPQVARALAASGLYDLVCYGHDHIAHEERLGRTMLLNPGEVMGLRGRSTFAHYVTRSQKVAWVELA